MEKKYNDLASPNLNEFFENLSKQTGLKRYSKEYNELVWDMIFKLSAANPQAFNNAFEKFK